MKILVLVASLFLSTFAWAHEGHDHGEMIHLVFAKGTIHAHATWIKGPQVSEESVLRIEWKNGADHTPLEPKGKFDVVLWMPAMGHGSSPTQVHQTLDSNSKPILGSYDVTDINFIMGDVWEVKVTLRLANGNAETQKFVVKVPESGGGHHH